MVDKDVLLAKISAAKKRLTRLQSLPVGSFRVFSEDLNTQDIVLFNLQQPGAQKSRYEFYLMRNEAAMRSVGIYLETELQAFFPDFVFWIVDERNKLTHIVLVDPKGQTGIVNPRTMQENEKVNIAINGHLDELAEKLTQIHGRKFFVHSFILLRDSSPLGTAGEGIPADDKTLAVIEAMKAKNVLRLDWSERRENGSPIDGSINGKSYLDMMFEKIGVKSALSG